MNKKDRFADLTAKIQETDSTFNPDVIPDANDSPFPRAFLRNNITEIESYEPEWVRMSEIKGREQRWFWQDVIPAETITLLAGVGGIGKSLLLLDLIAHTSNGTSFQACGENVQLTSGNVILLSAEDNIATQIQPKLVAANADLEKIHFIKSKVGTVSGRKRFLELDNDLYVLASKIEALGNENQNVTFIVIDPITYFLGKVKDNYNPEVANFLQGLIDLAEKYDIAMVINKHLRKQSSGDAGIKEAVSEISGAGAWANTPRMTWIITNWHDDGSIKVMTNPKQNLLPHEKTLESYAYRIGSYEGRGRLEWLPAKIKIDAEQAMNKESYEKSKQQTATDFFLNYLITYGQSRYVSIVEEAKKNGISERTMERAAKELKEQYGHKLSITKEIRSNRAVYQLI